MWKAYQGGKLKGRGEGLAAWHPIKPGGVLILGQEQVRGAEPPADGGDRARKPIRSSHMNRLEPHPSRWLLSFVSKTPTLMKSPHYPASLVSDEPPGAQSAAVGLHRDGWNSEGGGGVLCSSALMNDKSLLCGPGDQ